MKRIIQVQRRGNEVWYRVGYTIEANERFDTWQFGGFSLEEAVAQAKARFGDDYELVKVKHNVCL